MRVMFNFFYLIFILFTSLAYGASFNCTQANTQNEKWICASETISKLDDDLSAQYKELLKIYIDNSAVIQWQREWLKSDALKCQNSLCLEKAYQKRVAELKSALNAEAASKAYTGSYFRTINEKKDLNESNLLLVGLSNSRVLISGNAIWINPNNASSVHTGEINGYGSVKRGSVTSEDTSELCGASIQILESGSLNVENETGCGGLNVTFNGRYKRH